MSMEDLVQKRRLLKEMLTRHQRGNDNLVHPPQVVLHHVNGRDLRQKHLILPHHFPQDQRNIVLRRVRGSP